MVKRAYYHKHGRCLQSCDEQSANNCVRVIGYELMNGRDMKWKWRSTSAVQVHPPEVIVVITFPETNGGSGTVLRISPVHQFMESWAVTRYVSAEEHCTKQLTAPPTTTLCNTPSSGRIVSQPVTYRGPCAHLVRDVIKVDDGVKTTQPI